MYFARLTAITLALVCAVVVSALPVTVLACPFCSAPSLTFSEQLAQADAAVLVQWRFGEKGTEAKKDEDGKEIEEGKPASTTYLVREVLRESKGDDLKRGTRIDLARYRSAKEGDLFLILGTKSKTLEWGSPIEVTDTSYNYIAQAPSPEAKPEKRLAYFMKFLEYPDEMIANDAYAEFANAPYKDITRVIDKMPREKIAAWLQDEKTPATRIGLYGLMLGLCGDENDAKLMKEQITASTDEFRLGMDGVMGGYLLLTGDEGLQVIEETKLSRGEKKVPFSETYAAMQALRFVWKYGEDRISKDRLQESMRILLERPELADLVIADLARWKDWSVMDQLLSMYDQKEYDVPSIKRAVVRYLLVCSQDVPSGDDVKLPNHVIKAREELALLRERDPKTVKEAERFFINPLAGKSSKK